MTVSHVRIEDMAAIHLLNMCCCCGERWKVLWALKHFSFWKLNTYGIFSRVVSSSLSLSFSLSFSLLTVLEKMEGFPRISAVVPVVIYQFIPGLDVPSGHEHNEWPAGQVHHHLWLQVSPPAPAVVDEPAGDELLSCGVHAGTNTYSQKWYTEWPRMLNHHKFSNLS